MKDKQIGNARPPSQAVAAQVKGAASEGMRLQNPLKSVGLKLFLTFFLSIVVFVLAVGYMSYKMSGDIVKDKVSITTEETIIQSNGRLDLLLTNFSSKSMQVILDKDLLELMEKLNAGVADDFERFETQRNIQTELTNLMFSEDAIQSVHIYMENGIDISTGTSSEAAPRQTDWYERAQAANGAVVWMPVRKEGYATKGTATFGLSRKLLNPISSTVVGVLMIELKYNAFENQLKTVNHDEGSNVLLIDENNNISYAHDNTLVGSPVAIDMSLLPDTSGRIEGLDHSGADALLTYSRSTVTGWILVGTVPVHKLVEDAGQILNNTLIVAAIAAVFAMVIGFVLARTIGGPLVKLRNLMKQGENGDLRVRSQVKSSDEIGQLSKSFNEMMEKITLLVRQTNLSAQQVLDNSGELLDASKKTAVAAKEISVATEEIAGGASTLAVEAERGNDLTNHIGVQMRQVIEANVQMGSSAADVERVSLQGIEYMSQLIVKTNSTEEMTRSMVEKVDRLKESTTSIRKILEMLNSITKQTNILSLNATIEAARAGAAGKGFMVVADEIRKLADQSRQSIDVVGQITETIQTEIDETVQVLSEAYPLFQEQITSVKEADGIFKNVQSNMGGFIRQLDSVTESIQQLDQSQLTLSEAMSSVSAVSQQSSATSEEVASLSNEQLGVSEGLVTLAERLRTLSNSLKESLSRFTV